MRQWCIYALVRVGNLQRLIAGKKFIQCFKASLGLQRIPTCPDNPCLDYQSIKPFGHVLRTAHVNVF